MRNQYNIERLDQFTNPIPQMIVIGQSRTHPVQKCTDVTVLQDFKTGRDPLYERTRSKYKYAVVLIEIIAAILLAFDVYFLLTLQTYRFYLLIPITLSVLTQAFCVFQQITKKYFILASASTCLLATATTIVSIVVIQLSQMFVIGPLYIPYQDKLQLYWYSNTDLMPQIKVNQETLCSSSMIAQQNCSEKSKHHSVLIDRAMEGKSVQILNKSYTIPTLTPNTFNVISNLDPTTSHMNKMDSQLTLIVGDLNQGQIWQYNTTFNPFRNKIIVPALGDRDYSSGNEKFALQMLQRNSNYIQQIDDIAIVTVDFIMNQLAGQQFLWGALNMLQSSKHVFIQSHLTGYTADQHQSDQVLAKMYERIVDSHEFPNVRAVFSGHGRVFSAFKYESLFSFVLGAADNADEWWGGREQHGDISQQVYGGQYHLDSYLSIGFLNVRVSDDQIVYSYRDLEREDQGVVETYVQNV